MTIDNQTLDYIVAVQARLQAENLNPLNKEVCISSLEGCVLSKYCVHLYLTFIYPYEIYKEYKDNYIWVVNMAHDCKLTMEELSLIISKGKWVYEEINK